MTEHDAIFCTRTNRLIDTVLPGQPSAAEKLAKHMATYGPDLITLPFDEAYKRYEDGFKSAPEEITEDQWHEMLCVLPPMAWKHDSNGESFKMCEMTAGDITSIFVHLNGRYFTFADSARTPHAECCKRVVESAAYKVTP